MVTEIRRRASDKSTEEASSAITEFLLVQETEEKSRGWLLLNVLCLLTSGGQVCTTNTRFNYEIWCDSFMEFSNESEMSPYVT